MLAVASAAATNAVRVHARRAPPPSIPAFHDPRDASAAQTLLSLTTCRNCRHFRLEAQARDRAGVRPQQRCTLMEPELAGQRNSGIFSVRPAFAVPANHRSIRALSHMVAMRNLLVTQRTI